MIQHPDTMLDCALAPSPNFGPRRDGKKADMLILHYTGMPTADGALEWLCSEESQVSCHYFIFEDGRICQLVAEADRAWHAGVSCWAGETDINSCSIGIEIAYPGPPDGGDFSQAPEFPAAQMKAAATLCADIAARNGIAAHRVLAHSDVAPQRKIDPGDRFDWAVLWRDHIGLWIEDRPEPGDILFAAGSAGEDVRSVQRALGLFGYDLPESGIFDDATTQVVTALQRHYRQERVDGCVDRATLYVLEALLQRVRGIVAV